MICGVLKIMLLGNFDAHKLLDKVGHCVNTHIFVTKLLEWADKATFRDFTYRHETDAFRKLCLSVLLQRARPPQVDEAYKRLFTFLPTIKDVTNAPKGQIAELIRPSGMHQIKAERIRKLAEIILNQYNGRVPQNKEELLELPGIGEYAADVVLAWAFNQDVTMIDTNVYRILKRVGLIKEEGEARTILERLIPEGYRRRFNLIFIEFGGLICKPIKPRCPNCTLRDICHYAKSH
ncbi:MAG: G/T mismatches repair enzyme [Candidatus Bathyarchaeota archaeon BA1]|nr:MAG: G/T mismatches repair enzyme [Candidatus Bathyarchaeota archaeon BA1]